MCRRQGLEARRRCGFLPEDERGVRRPVWASYGVAIEECPRSYVRPASVELLERVGAIRAGLVGQEAITAREADALVVISQEINKRRE